MNAPTETPDHDSERSWLGDLEGAALKISRCESTTLNKTSMQMRKRSVLFMFPLSRGPGLAVMKDLLYHTVLVCNVLLLHVDGES